MCSYLYIYTYTQPLAPFFKDLGFGHAYTSLIGSLICTLLVLLQRHVFVWLMGVTIGFLFFVATAVWTRFLADVPAEFLLVVYALFAVVSSSVIGYVEGYAFWRVITCSVFGAVLFTDAIGMGQLSAYLQVMCVCVCVCVCRRSFCACVSRDFGMRQPSVYLQVMFVCTCVCLMYVRVVTCFVCIYVCMQACTTRSTHITY